MIPVTETWRQAIEAQFRDPGHLKVSIQVVPPGMREGARVDIQSGATSSPCSDLDKIIDGDLVSDISYATLEHNRFILDGSVNIMNSSDVYQEGVSWWSDGLEVNDVKIEFLLDKGYNVPGFHITWDTACQTFPERIVIEGFSGEVVTGKSEFLPKDFQEFYSLELRDVDRIILTINNWIINGWRARITEVLFGPSLSFSDRIISATQKAETSIIAEDLPKYSKSVTLDNYDEFFDPLLVAGISKYLTQRQFIKWQWGFSVTSDTIEWLPVQTVFLESSKINSTDGNVIIDITNRLSLLTSNYSGSSYVNMNVTYYDMALEVLQNSNILKEYDEELPWILPETLKNYKTNAPIPVEQTNSILQLIAGASGHILTVDEVTGYIEFIEFGRSVDRSITKSQLIENTGVEIADKLKSVSVNVYQYVFGSEETSAYDGTLNIKGTKTVEIEYASGSVFKDLRIVTSGGSLLSSQLNSRRAVLKLKGTETGTDIKITIYGKAIEQAYSCIKFYDNPDVVSGEDIVVQNELITNTETAEHVANIVKNFYSGRQVYDSSYTIYPEIEVADILELSSKYGIDRVFVESQSIDFNGGWTGNLKLRSIFNSSKESDNA